MPLVKAVLSLSSATTNHRWLILSDGSFLDDRRGRCRLTCAASHYSVLRHNLMERHPVSNTPEAEAYLPLTAPVFHVLVALADGDKHGYAILKEVADRTG